MKKQALPLIESLENRQLMHGVFPVTVDFAPASAPLAGGTVGDVGLVMGPRQGEYEYGWNIDSTANAVARTTTYTPYQRHKTFIDMQKDGPRTWEMHLHTGKYKVQVGAGDPTVWGGKVNITAEGKTVVTGTTDSSKRLLSGTLTLDVIDGKLTIANGSGATWNKIGYITIEYVGPASNTTPTPTPTPTPVTGKINWTTAASLPTGKAEAFGGAVGNKLYVFGGYVDNSFRPTDTAHVFNPATNKWTQIRSLPMRISHAATALDSRYVYMAGGYPATTNAQSFATNKVYRYDTINNTYESLPNLPVARGAAAGAIVNGVFYVMGGADSSRKDKADVYALNLNNLSAGWSVRKSMPEARNHPAAVSLNGFVYFVGGQTGQDNGSAYKTSLWRYDPAANTWSTLASLNSARSHITNSTFIYNGKIYAIGGEGVNQAKLKNVDYYDPSTNKWSASTALPSPRFSGVADILDGKIYFTGGYNNTFEKTTYVGVFA